MIEQEKNPILGRIAICLLLLGALLAGGGCRSAPKSSLCEVPEPVPLNQLTFSGESFDHLPPAARASIEWARRHGFKSFRSEGMKLQSFVNNLHSKVAQAAPSRAHLITVRPHNDQEPPGREISLEFRDAPVLAVLFYGAIGCRGHLLISAEGCFSIHPPDDDLIPMQIASGSKIIWWDDSSEL